MLKNKNDSLIQPTNGDFPAGLECLTGLSWDNVCDFQSLLHQLNHSLEVRFPCPSTSFDMKCRQYSQVPPLSHQTQQTFHLPQCSVMPLVRLFTFPPHVVKFDSFPTSFPEEIREEVMRMVHEIVSLKTRIIKANKERNTFYPKELG